MMGLAQAQQLQGQLHLAYETCQQGLQLAKTTEERYGGGLPATAWVQVVLGDLLREWNKLDEAAGHLEKCIELCRLWQVGDMLCASYLFQARVRQAQGDFAGALDSIRQAEQLPQTYRDVPWTGGPIPACRARLMLTQAVTTGDADHLESVEQLVEARGLRTDGEIRSLNDEIEHLVWVRLLIIKDEPDQALNLLTRLLQAADDGGRRGRVIEILALQALAYGALGDTQQALIPLERAISLAEPEGYVRLFVDEGVPMAKLLRQAESHGIAPDYVRALLEVLQSETKDEGPGTEPSPSSFAVRPSSSLVEPLSNRELEVLRWLNTDLSAPEIAAELVVSVNTVRTHIKRIYSKLDAHGRYEAVERAKELNLL
jgi:LuxR family maltose regulon positive regulatory protein